MFSGMTQLYSDLPGPPREFTGPGANLLWWPYDIIIFKLDDCMWSYCKGASISKMLTNLIN
jgi:hypothetical protein